MTRKQPYFKIYKTVTSDILNKGRKGLNKVSGKKKAILQQVFPPYIYLPGSPKKKNNNNSREACYFQRKKNNNFCALLKEKKSTQNLVVTNLHLKLRAIVDIIMILNLSY